jgi:3-phenylpropionate/cinnamic acid dioxygenase small subunit
VTPAERVQKASPEEHWACTDWLNTESALLDDQRLHEWLELLHPELEYKLPVRMTRERQNGPGFSGEAFHMLEDVASLTMRVKRLDTDYAWAEDPPSRSRRFVSNVRVSTNGDGDGALHVTSNLLIYRGRLDMVEYDIVTAERHDELVPVDGELKLRNRTVLLDHSTLPVKNLAIFF